MRMIRNVTTKMISLVIISDSWSSGSPVRSGCGRWCMYNSVASATVTITTSNSSHLANRAQQNHTTGLSNRDRTGSQAQKPDSAVTSRAAAEFESEREKVHAKLDYEER